MGQDKTYTKYSLYRPTINKNNYNTIGRYSKFIKQFVDLNDWGFLKKHKYSWEEMENNMFELNENDNAKHQLKGSINYKYTYNKGKPFGTGKNRKIINALDDIEELNKYSYDYSDYEEKWNKDGKITMHKERYLCMESHLLAALHNQKEKYLFYTTSPIKDFNIICLDVDDIENDKAYYGVVNFLSSIFPNCYYERSTNGSGLHFYIIISFSPARYFFSDVNEGVYRNVLYYLLSESLRFVVNNNFAVKFDAVKGTNAIYDEYNGFLKYGTLVKLPAPSTYEHFNALYSASVYAEEYLFCIINYFNDITCEYSSGVYNINSLMSSLSSILKDTTIRTSPRTSPRDLVSIIEKEKISSSCNNIITNTILPTITITNGGSFTLPGVNEVKNVRKKAKNEDYKNYTIIDIMNIGDSRIRESLYIKRYVGDYYSKHGIIPAENDVENNYRTEMFYDKIGDFRKKRFEKYYKHTADTFDIDKASDGASPYKIGMYDSAFSQTDNEITDWVKGNTSYKYNAYRYDVDITLEYIYICGKNKKNKARDALIQKYAKQESISEVQAGVMLKNTTPRKGLIGFYKFVKEKYKTVIIDGKIKKINLCDRKKASAMLDLVVELGLAECIDNTFDYSRARKFRLTEEVSQIRESWNVKDTALAGVNNETGLALMAV